MNGNAVTTTLAQLEEWAIRGLPAEERWRGRAAVRFALGLVPWGALFAVVFAALGQWLLAGSLSAAAVGVGSVGFVLRSTRSARFAGHWLTTSLLQSLLIPAWLLGGLQAACVPWMAACVVAATVLAGRAAGVVWAGIAMACTAALLAAHLTGALPEPIVELRVVWALAALAHSGLFAVVLAMVLAADAVTAQARAELEAARSAAEAASHAKSDFLARMSHELRTPLNAVIGYAELMAEAAGPQDLQDLHRIRDAGNLLLTVVNDVLDLSKVEADRMDFRRDVLDLHALVTEVVDAARPVMAGRQNQLITVLEGGGRVVADDLRLRQCLTNLLSNADKFTRGGEIKVVARDSGGRVQVEVHDSGVGMTAEQVARVFEPFAQATEETARTHGGTGLGLAIVRRFVERMGGSVHARSEVGVGSVFVLDLPAAITHAPA
jgi:signal transduction histidine kinase